MAEEAFNQKLAGIERPKGGADRVHEEADVEPPEGELVWQG